jgi:hypothetical protein
VKHSAKLPRAGIWRIGNTMLLFGGSLVFEQKTDEALLLSLSAAPGCSD